MSDTSERFAAPCALLTALMLASATPSSAQPTEAQKDAVKDACRSDYMAHCPSYIALDYDYTVNLGGGACASP
jgi:hypothetical protein